MDKSTDSNNSNEAASDEKVDIPAENPSYAGSLISFLKEGSSISEHILKMEGERTGSFDSLDESDKTIDEITSKIKSDYRKLKTTSEKLNLMAEMNRLITKIKQKAFDSHFIRKRDKFAYVFFTLRLILGCFLMGKWPCYYP